MAILNTSGIVMPKELVEPIWKKAIDESVIARLSKEQPQKFGESEAMTLVGTPRAELVGEGDSKSPSGITFGSKTVVPRKLQTTVRVSEEVMWADEDHQLSVLAEVGEAIGYSLARALDLVGIHGINPLTGAASASITDALKTATNIVTAGEDGEIDIEAAIGLILADHYRPNGVALDSNFAYDLATLRYADGRKKFPEIGLTNKLYGFAGLNASSSDTVSGSPEIAIASKILAVVGNWDAFKWGVQRQIKLRVITAGDPDGQGDLNRQNQVALRAETVYGIGVMDLNAFALIKTA